ncbi:MAG TPA: lytic transglycosylase domain-containing protein [Oxalicibacterium sp.]|nr:lytic transglycosylase domain-containing protein [Oxalicibacterium sp.]
MRTLLLSLAMSLLPAAAAHADIWGYIDARGDAHFAAEQLDERYQLFMKGDAEMDASRILPPSAAEKDTPLFRYLSQHPNLKKYEKYLNKVAREYQLDPALLKAVMAAESGFDPAAVSPRGAIGLMQVLPSTAERFGLQADKKRSIAQKLTDPKINIRLGARYLHFLHKLYPDQLPLMLASYNAGEGAVQKYNAIPPFPETRNYVKVVTQFYHLYQPAGSGTGNFSSTAKPGRRLHMTIPADRRKPALEEADNAPQPVQ